MTDPSGDEPDLLSQATAAQPMTHARRSSRHRRRRRRGRSPALIGGIVFVVLVVIAGGAIAYAHRSTKSTINPPGALVSVSWTYHDLAGHGVTVVPSSIVKFVAGGDTDGGQQIPQVVLQMDKAGSSGNCLGLSEVYAISYRYLTEGGRTTSLRKTDAGAFAAYALAKGKAAHCSWTDKVKT